MQIFSKFNVKVLKCSDYRSVYNLGLYLVQFHLLTIENNKAQWHINAKFVILLLKELCNKMHITKYKGFHECIDF